MSDNPTLSERDDFMCGFCLQVTEADDYPIDCLGCQCRACVQCGSGIKGKWCRWCGRIVESTATFYRTSSFAAFYAEEAWFRRNRSTVASVDEHLPAIHIKEPRYRVYRRPFDGTPGEYVRELTPEEVAVLYPVSDDEGGD